MDYQLLGKNVRKYRIQIGMKQEELAEKSRLFKQPYRPD